MINNPHLLLSSRVVTEKKGASFIVLVGDKVACSLKGDIHHFKKESTAQAYAYQLSKGFYGDTSLHHYKSKKSKRNPNNPSKSLPLAA